MDEYIHITRWDDFQHDKRRKGAPWHKEHAAQLDNDAYLALTLGARGLLIGLRLMYGRRHPEGVSVEVARRTLSGSANDAKYFGAHLDSLNHAGFLTVGASKTLAACAQNASAVLALEEETEREGEKNKIKTTTSQPEARPEANGSTGEIPDPETVRAFITEVELRTL